MITASRRGCVHAATREPLTWNSRSVEIDGVDSRDIHQVVPLSSLGLFLVAGVNQVHLVNLDNYGVVHTFQTEAMHQRSLQSAFTRGKISQTGSLGLTSFTLCYTAAESGDCIIQTYLPRDNDGVICSNSSATPTRRGWCNWENSQETKKPVENPGTWSVLSDTSVVGIRQKFRRDVALEVNGRNKTEGLRHRSPRKDGVRDLFGRWEVWTISQGGRVKTDETRPLFQDNERAGHLIVSELGPMIRVGQRSVAFSFGNVVKVVTVGGYERFESGAEEKNREYLNVGSRRRKGGLPPRPRAWT